MLHRHSVKFDEMNESDQAEGGVKVKDSSRILGLEEKNRFLSRRNYCQIRIFLKIT